MNQYGSYRKLLQNSKQALFAAIEIYNKPKFDYREEVFVVLLVNAWDLLLLAILSKNKRRIFQKKKKGQPYKTLDFNSSYKESCPFFTSLTEEDKRVLKMNLLLIRDYRNEVIHYYGNESNQHAIYALSQSAIKNYVDLLNNIFDEDVINEINIVLLPLSFNTQPDFVEFFKRKPPNKSQAFVSKLFANLKSLEDLNLDSNRLVTQCYVKIENVKNIKYSDITAVYDENSPSFAIKETNVDVSHPYFQMDIIGRTNKISGKNKKRHEDLRRDINSYEFQAIAYKHKFKENKLLCWRSKKGGSPRYSSKVIELINGLSDQEISTAKEDYKNKETT